jgi:hypothetical protein
MGAAKWSGCNATAHQGIGEFDDIAGRDSRALAWTQPKG